MSILVIESNFIPLILYYLNLDKLFMKSQSILLRFMSVFLVVGSVFSVNADSLERAIPESVGVSSKAVYELFDTLTNIEKVEIHSVIIMRHGKVVGELYPAPYKKEYKHTMYSCSKTFVGVAIGLAVDENKLSVDDKVYTYLEEYVPKNISKELADLSIADLLTMRSGMKADWITRNKYNEWTKIYLSHNFEEMPGKVFRYDSMCTYILSHIIQQVTGKKVIDYLQEKIFDEMDIHDAQWETSPEGVNTGGWGLHIGHESLAKFGQLMLDYGKWKGKQLVSEDWMRTMLAKHVETPNPAIDDYGYQSWQCIYPSAVRADGALGQYIISIPDKNMVVVMTQCCKADAVAERAHIWNFLNTVTEEQLPENKKEYQMLLKKQSRYSLPLPEGKKSSSVLADYENKTIELGWNILGWKWMKLCAEKDKLVMTVEERDGIVHDIDLGYMNWHTIWSEAYPHYSLRSIENCMVGLDRNFGIAGSYAWSCNNVLNAELQYVNWVTGIKLDIMFEGNGKVQFKIKENYNRKSFKVFGKVEE